MIKAVAVFFTCFALIFTTTVSFSNVNAFYTSLGWLILVVFTANVTTKWILAVIPQDIVNPERKAVVITGCDTGFGLGLAHRLQAYGFYVYACCLSEDSEGTQELSNLTKIIKVLMVDVTKYDQVQNAAKEVEADLGDKDLWCVVNNAGVAIFSEFEWCSMSVIENMFQVNVLGTVRVTKVFLPLLRKSKGRVVIVSSLAGRNSYPGALCYCMTKNSLVSFADGLRREMRKFGVGVISIEPAMHRTHLSLSDVITSALNKSWELTPDAIKEAYGLPYFDDFKDRFLKMARAGRPPQKVVDCMEQAITNLQPKFTYTCSSPIVKIKFWIFSFLPTQLIDIMVCNALQPSHKLPCSGRSRNKKSS